MFDFSKGLTYRRPPLRRFNWQHSKFYIMSQTTDLLRIQSFLRNSICLQVLVCTSLQTLREHIPLPDFPVENRREVFLHRGLISNHINGGGVSKIDFSVIIFIFHIMKVYTTEDKALTKIMKYLYFKLVVRRF